MKTHARLWLHWLLALLGCFFINAAGRYMILPLPLLLRPPWLLTLPLRSRLQCLTSWQGTKILVLLRLMLWLPWLPMFHGCCGQTNAPAVLHCADCFLSCYNNFILSFLRPLWGHIEGKGPCWICPLQVTPDRNNTSPTNVNKSDIY
jgi:hypothetical protein